MRASIAGETPPGCSPRSSAEIDLHFQLKVQDAAHAALLLKDLTQERLLFHSNVDKQHDDENAKDGQLQAPREAIL